MWLDSFKPGYEVVLRASRILYLHNDGFWASLALVGLH